ncbi:cell division protein ZipA C-terminal FtsZ-binding domain-containing protein [Massilia sp. CF038]|uniref:cell division protein ZipA C-terminal FtsZ-binding domain-containing protein n=1 Tax=Massilia sp. CF038 TaxID=1881045 RepID=UPI0009181170|nr:cell division protein ZipA C-terminal FtsZ-binding domain-containing protein [Massilia sp. CF038]SHG69664.1 Cell division protein ZipA, interacts with FtsZ [Massilia sp. CF038]
MTDIEMSISIGAVIVAGVIVYNKWQEHKARKSVARAFSSDHDDVLMRTDEARQEPSFDLHGGAADKGRHDEQDMHDNVPILHGTDPTTPAAELAISLVDPLIDCLIPLALEVAVRGDKILPILQTLRHVGNKPVHFIGLHVNGDWEPITHGGVYTKLQAGVQLASRTTALNELEYSELITRLRAVSDDIGAEPEIPDMIEVMGEARTLHRFVAGHDAQLGVNLLSNGAPWSIATLIGALEKQGFDVRPDGRYIMPDGDGGQLFTLSTNVTLGADTTSRLTLLLDVPCVAPSRDGFGQMVACAKALVGRLDAIIVDDSDQPLMDPALAEINNQVLDFYHEMEAAEIAAGSTRAMRLFS